MVSIPNSGLLLQVSSFILFFDEFSYYTYHKTRYDSAFRLLAQFCWNVTNNKWVPSFLSQPYQQVSNAFNFMVINDSGNVTPANLQYGGDTLFFIDNTQQFILATVPLSFLTFFLIKSLHPRLPNKLKGFLKPFSWWSSLLVGLVGGTTQYLSFRCFEQLRYPIPSQGLLGYCNIVLTLTFQPFVLICCCSMYFLFRRYA